MQEVWNKIEQNVWDKVNQLKILVELKEKWALTDEEFSSEKQKIMW